MGINYQNPYELHYCLLKELPTEIEKQVLAKVQIPFGDINIDLAVIGSSHFLHFPDYFCEILTCLPPKNLTHLVFQQQVQANFFYQTFFQKFDYQVYISFHDVGKNAFMRFEKNLLDQSHVLCHSFEKESAITSIQLIENHQHLIKIQTWHTYPEKFVVVQTQTLISQNQA